MTHTHRLLLLTLTGVAALTLALLASADAPDRHAMRFGVNGGAYPGMDVGADRLAQVTRRLDGLGMVWLRHPGRGSTWWEVQPARDRWDFAKIDAVLDGSGHPWLLEIYGQVGTVWPFHPDFSPRQLRQQRGPGAVMNYIRSCEADLSDETQRADAEVYVREFVRRYRDRVPYWEIGNEGIVADHRYELLCHTYTWIKDEAPEATVLVTGLAGDDESTFAEHLAALDRLLDQGAGACFDVGNVHYYGHSGDDLEERLLARMADYQQVLQRHGLGDRPIWVTETATSSEPQGPLSGPSSEAQQARDVIRRLVVLSAAGADRVLWHGYRETDASNKFHGCNIVVPGSGAPKPAHDALRLLVGKVGFFESVETLRSDDVWLVRFTNPGGREVLVGWADTPLTVDLTPHVGSEEIEVVRVSTSRGSSPVRSTVAAAAVPLDADPLFME